MQFVPQINPEIMKSHLPMPQQLMTIIPPLRIHQNNVNPQMQFSQETLNSNFTIEKEERIDLKERNRIAAQKWR